MFEAVIMHTERGRRRARTSDWGRDDGAGWELVGCVGGGVACVKEDEVGQAFFRRLWATEWLFVQGLLSWIGAGFGTRPWV